MGGGGGGGGGGCLWGVGLREGAWREAGRDQCAQTLDTRQSQYHNHYMHTSTLDSKEPKIRLGLAHEYDMDHYSNV